jgi:cysteine synthase A
MPHTKIILSEPDLAPMLASGTPQEREEDGSAAGSHPAWQPHPIQGWSPDFIPHVLQEAVDNAYYDELLPVTGEEGVKGARMLATKEGIITGISGGSTFAVARRVAQQAEKGSVILAMLPDTGERYLSTPLFEAFGADMSEEEKELSLSTPSAQLP